MFSRCKSVQYLATDEIDDHRIQSDYKCTNWQQTSRGKNSVLGIASALWNRARHRWQRDHQDPEHLLHSAHEHWHVKWICAQFSSLFCSVFVTLDCKAHRGSRVFFMSSHSCMKCAVLLRLWSPFSSTSSSSNSSLTSCTSSCTSSTSLTAVATLRTPPKRVRTLLTTLASSQKTRWLE